MTISPVQTRPERRCWVAEDTPAESRDFGEVFLQFLKHGPGATSLVRCGRKGATLRKCRPRDGNQLRGCVELHGARTKRDHGMGQTQVTVFKLLDVPHHLRFRPVAVEHGMVQIIDFAGNGPQECGVKPHTLHRADAQCRAKVGQSPGRWSARSGTLPHARRPRNSAGSHASILNALEVLSWRLHHLPQKSSTCRSSMCSPLSSDPMLPTTRQGIACGHECAPQCPATPSGPWYTAYMDAITARRL